MYVLKNFRTINLIKREEYYIFDSSNSDSFSIIINPVPDISSLLRTSSPNLTITGIDDDLFISESSKVTENSDTSIASKVSKVTYRPISILGAHLKTIFTLNIFLLDDTIRLPVIYRRLIDSASVKNLIVPFNEPTNLSRAEYLIILFESTPSMAYPVFIDSMYRFIKLEDFYYYKNIYVFTLPEKLIDIIYFASIFLNDKRINSIFLTHDNIIDSRFTKSRARFKYSHLMELGEYLGIDKKIKNIKPSALTLPIHDIFSLRLMSKTLFNVSEEEDLIKVNPNTTAFIRYKLIEPVENMSIILSGYDYSFDFFVSTDKTKFTPGIIQRMRDSGNNYIEMEEGIVEISQGEILFTIKSPISSFGIYFITTHKKIRVSKRQIRISYINHN